MGTSSVSRGSEIDIKSLRNIDEIKAAFSQLTVEEEQAGVLFPR